MADSKSNRCERCGAPCARRFCTTTCAVRSRPRRTLEQRFWAKVQRGGPDECWPWTGAHGLSGHGQMVAGEALGRAGKITSAHRVSYVIANGPVADQSLHVLHRCDNPPCVNPAHLFLGTPRDNMQDAIAKGRFRFPAPRPGEQNNKAKLTWALVRDIRNGYAAGEDLSSMSRRLHIARSTLREVVKGRNWREPGVATVPLGSPTKKFTDSQIAEMRALYALGFTQQQIADNFGAHQGYVSQVVRNASRVI